MTTAGTTDIAIIGTGFSGIGMAIRLLQRGVADFTVFEKASCVGGTWRDNTYPGVACDVPSHLYSFSFAPNPSWSRMFSPGPEIRAYLERCATDFGVLPHVRFGSEVVRAAWLPTRQRWELRLSTGETWHARVLVAGMGGLHRPAYPDIPGRDRFAGLALHSALWRDDVDLTGKRVAVIGTGASAIQFVPQIAPHAKELLVFQRTAPWVMAKADRPIEPWEQRLFARWPVVQKLVRAAIYTMLEVRVPGFTRLPWALAVAQRWALRHLHAQVPDAALRAKLTPDYTMGCKRVLLSNDYYPALTRPNVTVVTDRIAEIRPGGLTLADGTQHDVDVLLYGTGFQATDPMPPGVVFGRDGRDIVETWRDGPQAFQGTTVSGFPNLFLLMGPNTGLGHSSMVYMIESQITYVLAALDAMRARRADAVDVRLDVQDAFNAELQAKLAETVWQSGGCRSWYQHASGRNVVLWPGFTWAFRQLLAEFHADEYEFLQAAEGK